MQPRPSSPTLRRISFAALLLLGAAPGFADDNPYDLLGKVLVPLISLMAPHPSTGEHAVTTSFRVEESHGYSQDLAGQQGAIAFEAPDKLRLEAPFFGENIILCRRGTHIWAWPGAKLRALLADPDVASHLPEPDRKYQLHPFSLPLPEKQMVFLPALFQAKAAPEEAVDDVRCQVIDAEVTPFVAATIGADGWTGRLWVNPDHQLMRMRLQGPDTAVLLRLDKTAYAKTLALPTWYPTKAQQDDIVLVPPARYDQLIRSLMGLK